MLGEAKNACKQITEKDGLAKPKTLAKAQTNWAAIDETIIITANIADGIG